MKKPESHSAVRNRGSSSGMCDGGGAPTALVSIPVGGGSGPLCGGGCFEDGSGPRGADDRRSVEPTVGPVEVDADPISGLDFVVTGIGSGPRGTSDRRSVKPTVGVLSEIVDPTEGLD